MIKKALTFLAPALLTVGLMASVAPVAPAEAAGLSDKQVQWNLAGLGYLKYNDIDGKYGPKTKAAVRSFQTNRCLGVDGVAGRQTDDELLALVRAVQGKVGAGRDGKNGPNTKQKIINWQRNHGLAADGMAGPGTFAKMGIGPWKKNCGGGNPGGGTGDTRACPGGTRDLGVHDTWSRRVMTRKRLCAITDFKSRGAESNPGSSYGILKADGDVIVSVDVAGQVRRMYDDAKRDGVTFEAKSAFRSMAHQKFLCYEKYASTCGKGNYTLVARPGTSKHQNGTAIDFVMTKHGARGVKGTQSCSNRHSYPNSETWRWLRDHAKNYGFGQYSAEAWHWDTLNSSNRCR